MSPAIVVVLVTNQPVVSEIIFTHAGNFSHGLNAQNRADIHEWCIAQWGVPGPENGWELYISDGYMFARVPVANHSAAMNAKMRWHGVPDI